MPHKLIDMKKKQGGDAWLTSYADLMSLLTCFFLLLYNTGKSDPIRQKKIEDGILATFAPKRLKKIIEDQTSEIHRAFYIMMSLIQLENESPDTVIKKIDNIYKKNKSLVSVREYLEEKSPDSIKSLKNKIKNHNSRGIIIEYILQKQATGTINDLSKQQIKQIMDLGKALRLHNGLSRIEVVRYRPKQAFFHPDSSIENKNRMRHTRIARILSDSGIDPLMISMTDEVFGSFGDKHSLKNHAGNIHQIGIRIILNESF